MRKQEWTSDTQLPHMAGAALILNREMEIEGLYRDHGLALQKDYRASSIRTMP